MKWTDEAKLVRRIARDLRYLSMDDLINRKIAIHQMGSVEKDIENFLSHRFPSGCSYLEPEKEFVMGAIAKYGIIDATLLLNDFSFPQSCESGISLLKKLNFVEDPKKDNYEPAVGGDLTCLAYLAECFEKNQILIRLLLIDDQKTSHPMNKPLKATDNYFPRAFRIEDACVTNNSFVWFLKHFYV